MRAYDTYLFDADGTLYDTVDLICNCFDYVTQKYGNLTVSREEIIGGIGSPLRHQLMLHLDPNLDHQTILDDYLQYQLSIMEEGITPFPHVTETLETLKNAGKKLAVVTSRRRISLNKILESTDTLKYFDVLVTPEDTLKHKPHSEPALKAMDLLDADPQTTVFTGDAHYDICSGNDAGVDTIFVNWSHVDKKSLPIQPTWAIDSLKEITDCLE